MLRYGEPPYLECSTKGDRRFSALCARIRGRGNLTIEDIYQAAKQFEDGNTGLNWRAAKGRQPVNVDEVRALYGQLWREYIAENPELVAVLCSFAGLSDIFGQAGHACQAEELWKIRENAMRPNANYPNDLNQDFCLKMRSAVFVFGSNLLGIHGKGAALFAKQHRGAINGHGIGLQGQSYALPTKRVPPTKGPNGLKEELMPLGEVAEHVAEFKRFASSRPDLTFQVVRVGCSLAGFTDDQIAPLFDDAPDNCLLPGVWLRRRDPTLIRLVIAGNRKLIDFDWMSARLDRFTCNIQNRAEIEVVCGGAGGGDEGGYKWAKKNGLRITGFMAEWERLKQAGFGKIAGFLRNDEMGWYGTHLAAFKWGESPGTNHMISTAKSGGLLVRELDYGTYPRPAAQANLENSNLPGMLSEGASPTI